MIVYPAIASLLLWAYGAVMSVRVFVKNGAGPGLALPWMFFPLMLVLAAFAATRRQRVAPMWMPIGALWGFVILAAWSVGPFYFGSAAALTAAGGAHFAAIRSWWRAFILPLWWLAGLTGCAVFLLLLNEARARVGGYVISPAPAVLAGSWVFGAVCAALASSYVARALWINRLRAPAWVALAVTVAIAALAWFASFSLRRATDALQNPEQIRQLSRHQPDS